MPHRAKFCNTMDALCPNLLHAQRGGRDADVFLDGQAGIEEVRRLRHDTVRRPNHLGIDAIVRRIGYKVDAFTAKNRAARGIWKALVTRMGFFQPCCRQISLEKAAFSAVFRLLSSIKIRLSGTPSDRSIRFSICDSLASLQGRFRRTTR